MSYPVFVLGESGTGKSTSLRKLNTKECAEFMQKVEAYAISELCVIFGVNDV